MSSKLAVTQKAQYFDLNGNPLSGGSVTYYLNGTTTKKDIYLNEDKSTPANNPQVLDAGGWVANNDISAGDGAIWYGEGYYDVVVKDVGGATIYTVENVAGADLTASGAFSFISVETMADMVALDVTAYDLVYVLGYYDYNDNGGGWFKLDGAGVESPNGGTIFSPTAGSGRWKRVLNDDAVLPQMFGAIPNDPTVNCTTPLSSMIDWCKANEAYSNIQFGAGDYSVQGTVTFDGDIKVTFVDGARFIGYPASGSNSIVISCSDVDIQSFKTALVEPLVTDSTDLTFSPLNLSLKAKVEWWGTYVGGTNVELGNAIAGTSQPLVFSGGAYATTGTRDYSNNYVIFENDSKLVASVGVNTFDKFEVNQSGYAFDGVFKLISTLNFSFEDPKEYKASWFGIDSAGAINNDNYEDVIASLPDSPVFVWDGKDYAFSGTNVVDRSNVNNVINGSVLTFNGLTDFGRVQSCTVGGISSAGSGELLIYNRDLDVEWFGAMGDSTNATIMTNNVSAINYALAVQEWSTLNEFNSYVSGGAFKYYIDTAIDFTQDSSKKSAGQTINIRNLNLKNTSSFTPVVISSYSFMVALRGNISLENVELENVDDNDVLYSNGDVVIKDSNVNSTATFKAGLVQDIADSSCSIKDSYLQSYRPVISEAIDVELVGSEYVGNGVDSYTSFNKCENGLVSGNNFKVVTSRLRIGSINSLTVTGNRFGSYLEVFSGFENVTITGNNFIDGSAIDLESSTTDFIVSALTIVGNSFRDGTASGNDIINLNGSGTFADDGHFAVIHSNGERGYNTKSTRAVGSNNFNCNSVFTNPRLSVNTAYPTELILPYAVKTISTIGGLKYVGGTSVPTTVDAGIVSVADNGPTGSGAQTMELRYTGAKTDGTGDYYQLVTFYHNGEKDD